MSRRGVAILMILTAAIALGALVQDYRFDEWIARERASAIAAQMSSVAGSESVNPIPGNDNSAARAAGLEAIERRVVQLSQFRLAMNGVALIFVLSVVLYLGRVVTSLSVRGEQTTAQMLRDLPPPVKMGAAASHAASPSAGAPAQPAAPVVQASTLGLAGSSAAVAAAAPASPRQSSLSSLPAAAELCVDLAKVIDAAEIPALLERTAIVLGARGLVIWAIDADGARLRPSLSHGYADKVLAKVRPIQIDSDNVTALAFRSLQPQAMNGVSAADAAAIAIPLLTASGCVGVLSAELRHSRPHADLLPVARILGAQFSTLIAPAEDTSRRAHA